MTIFTLRSIKKDFGIKELLTNASFSLDEGDKVGLIGTNGSGKSTLLKMIAGLESIDSGDRWVNPGSTIVYLPQQPDLDESHTVLEQVFADSGEQMALVREYEEISDELSHGKGDTDKLMARLSTVSARIDEVGAWDLETKAKLILTKLGIEDFHAKIGDLSGGYRKRIALATALLSEPDVLLMDEPTNHLDALSVEWLQNYLNGYRGALLLITHDRYFLDRVTNRILEIDRADLYNYAGNYAYYLEKKALAEESAASTQRKFSGVLRRELEWLKKGPKARSTKQKARIDRIKDMRAEEFKTANGKVEIATAGRRIGKKVIELLNIRKAYGDRTLIKDFTYNFTPEDRIGIIGCNGAGKSTLMDIITGRIQPDSGTVEIGTTIHIGYFDQHSEDLTPNEDQRVIEYLKSVAELVQTADGEIITASQMLEKFLFPPNQQYAPINKLSGGEKRRLFLLKVLMSAPNVLILDEPTNDLDVQTLAVLEDYLEDFNGCVIVVSHDRYFLDRTIDMVFALEPGGNLRLYPGNYSVYLDYKKAEEAKELKGQKDKEKLTRTAESNNSSAKVAPQKSTKVSFNDKREYEQLETKIPKLEAEKAEIEKILSNNAPSGFAEVKKLSDRLAKLTHEIDTATERWLDLAERLG
ncbi:MAG: ABC-F family ATP-binding cassette domain-containing protein [Microcoleus sp. PH2017_01_SCD_O_A]|jgi:ABC transport system ATP-binding/permease protein|uniref:ABC-F family ATP-binding cassette domain-containing protein n=1 Tax=unclassified Microcoleus TaxID=2642155 RepID=UPI001DD661F7|nr:MULTISPECIES: ABC-F family ATP-binding cassette domain-containing protein [unclassified Microcoleus]MCC3421641.1 ABC-F family ATP-binding cassette domain-containing protein [Microcoleus sp. PH2017_07_MST_O_A]TAE69553.1 MAG: ABC transporter ATP-binding protein [Oscillatoriales cyanobacterium]MCC3424137.1 ABC-F family ATP-binding cassette domain-containing protein [Microcoleus sp. PH2017_01_SCD_O_A]MCC3454281.1 ABC-F family ATP-binding cassette domain-containing protein [Microcoleus sp. PH2017